MIISEFKFVLKKYFLFQKPNSVMTGKGLTFVEYVLVAENLVDSFSLIFTTVLLVRNYYIHFMDGN